MKKIINLYIIYCKLKKVATDARIQPLCFEYYTILIIIT